MWRAFLACGIKIPIPSKISGCPTEILVGLFVSDLYDNAEKTELAIRILAGRDIPPAFFLEFGRLGVAGAFEYTGRLVNEIMLCKPGYARFAALVAPYLVIKDETVREPLETEKLAALQHFF